MDLEILKPVEGVASKVTKEHRMVRSLMTRDEIQDAIIDYGQGLPDAVMKWAES
jgi:hypothetical protein